MLLTLSCCDHLAFLLSSMARALSFTLCCLAIIAPETSRLLRCMTYILTMATSLQQHFCFQHVVGYVTSS